DQRGVRGGDALTDLGLVDRERDPAVGHHGDVEVGRELAALVGAPDPRGLRVAAAERDRERQRAAADQRATQEATPGDVDHGWPRFALAAGAGSPPIAAAALWIALRIRG